MFDIEEEIINEIGNYLGFNMDSEKAVNRYDFVITTKVVYNKTPLLIYKYNGCFHGFKALYVLNMTTLKPTKNSYIKKQLPKEVLAKLKPVRIL